MRKATYVLAAGLLTISASPVPQVKDPNIQGGQMYVSLPLTDGEMAVIRSIINVRTSTRTVNPQNYVLCLR